jgi:FkbH-like protein
LTTHAAVPLVLLWFHDSAASPIARAVKKSVQAEMSSGLEQQLRVLRSSHPNLIALPIDEFLAERGFNVCFDARNFYAARCPFSFQGLEVVARVAVDVLRRVVSPAKKVLVIDLDNTLWGGVVGEAGIEGLVLGTDGIGFAFQQFQAKLLELRRNGILLALASKNNAEDAWNVFDRHEGMILKREDIAAARVNWKEKPDSIREIAEELGLGLDSFVFWDDNPLEQAKVREFLPQVTVLDVPAEVVEWPRYLAKLVLFDRFDVTDDDRRKADQYRARSQFVSERGAATDVISFLKSTEPRPSVIPLTESNLKRAAQLCQKTNQFNLRTVRYTEAELKAIEKAGHICFLTQLKDRFGDHGIVALTVVKTWPGRSYAFLDSFMISCRVLGRHLESWILSEAVRRAQKKGCTHIVGEFINTERNDVSKDFLATNGFRPLNDSGGALSKELQLNGAVFEANLKEIKIPFLEIYDHKN